MSAKTELVKSFANLLHLQFNLLERRAAYHKFFSKLHEKNKISLEENAQIYTQVAQLCEKISGFSEKDDDTLKLLMDSAEWLERSQERQKNLLQQQDEFERDQKETEISLDKFQNLIKETYYAIVLCGDEEK